MHIFTSITANYLPKAATLAHSVKRVHPEAKFHLILSDDMPSCSPEVTEAFDSIINITQLPIEGLHSWIFKHRLVELCTAVKGMAFQYIADRFGAERIYYFDPDIVVCNRLDDLNRTLDRHSILLTPHQFVPDTDLRAIRDNEICCLRNGVYNLGFLAVRMTDQGRRFIDWWAERLRYFCYDEVSNGLFTDQRWIDLAPAFFDDISIIREPQYNVATWNLTSRYANGRVPYDIEINGRPLVFYHFSGFDSGAQKIMLEVYGSHSPVLFEFRDWYIARCEELGQTTLGKIDCIYKSFRNGEGITDEHRILYRRNETVERAFPDPFDTTEPDPVRSYFHWFQAEILKEQPNAIDAGDQSDTTTTPRRPFLQLIRDYTPPPTRRLVRSAWRRLLRSA